MTGGIGFTVIHDDMALGSECVAFPKIAGYKRAEISLENKRFTACTTGTAADYLEFTGGVADCH